MSNKRITVEVLNSYRFIKIPKELIFNLEKYYKLSAEAILIYGLLFDRLELSAKNGWINENGEIYIKFKKEVISKLVRIKSRTTVINVFKELKDCRLIEEIQKGSNKANEIYLLQTEFSYNQITDEEILDLEHEDNNILKSGCSKNGRPKNEHPDVQKMDVQNLNTNDTNIYLLTNTNIINTNLEEETFQRVLKKYRECISEKVVEGELSQIRELTKCHGSELVIKAIEIALSYKGQNLRYIQSTLADWQNKGLGTPEQVDNHFAKWIEKNQAAKNNREKQVKLRAENNETGIKTNFNDYEQRKYNYDELEKKLLEASASSYASTCEFDISELKSSGKSILEDL